MTSKPFLVGDFRSNTGPAIANKALKKTLGKRAFYSVGRTRLGRMLELILKIPFCETVCFCGFSKLNVYGIRMAKLLKKKTGYLMHGYIKLEDEFNGADSNISRIDAERFVINNTDMLICVSNLLVSEIREDFPNRKNIHVVYNIIENNIRHRIEKDPLLIFSTGGGMPQKNNLVVCEAIKVINATLPKDKQLKYVIAGKLYGHDCDFAKYGFVEYVGNISHDECLRIMEKSSSYIQNSLFETFGIAVIEAIECGCGVILSKNIGALEVIDGLDNEYVVDDSNDINEIARKLYAYVIEKKEFGGKVNWDKVSGDYLADRFLKIVRSVAV